MDGEIPRGLTGRARLDAERNVRETMMKYLVRWRRRGNDGSEEEEEQLQSDVPNLVLKERAPKAIIRFFEVRFRRLSLSFSGSLLLRRPTSSTE